MPSRREVSKHIVELASKRVFTKTDDGYMADTVGGMASIQWYQRQPYTCVIVDYDGEYGRATGAGFSKVRWPDRWNSQRGYEIALGKAAQDVAEQLV